MAERHQQAGLWPGGGQRTAFRQSIFGGSGRVRFEPRPSRRSKLQRRQAVFLPAACRHHQPVRRRHLAHRVVNAVDRPIIAATIEPGIGGELRCIGILRCSRARQKMLLCRRHGNPGRSVEKIGRHLGELRLGDVEIIAITRQRERQGGIDQRPDGSDPAQGPDLPQPRQPQKRKRHRKCRRQGACQHQQDEIGRRERPETVGQHHDHHHAQRKQRHAPREKGGPGHRTVIADMHADLPESGGVSSTVVTAYAQGVDKQSLAIVRAHGCARLPEADCHPCPAPVCRRLAVRRRNHRAYPSAPPRSRDRAATVRERRG